MSMIAISVQVVKNMTLHSNMVQKKVMAHPFVLKVFSQSVQFA